MNLENKLSLSLAIVSSRPMDTYFDPSWDVSNVFVSCINSIFIYNNFYL